MIHRFLLCMFLALAISLPANAQPVESNPGSSYEYRGENWDWSGSSDEGGGSSYLGVDIADVSAERLAELKLKEEHGAEVTMVDQDAPAGKAGLHEHDVIVSLNGAPVESAAQLRRMIKETPSGRVVNLGISRDGQAMTIKVQLADRRKSMAWQPNLPKMPEMPAMPEMTTMPDFDIPVSVVIVHSSLRSGLMVENLTAQLGDFFGVKDGKGVLVRSVEKGSRAEKAGFHAGDVVTKVNNQPVHDTSDFTHALRSSSGAAAVTVMRDKREQTLTLSLPEKKDSGILMEESLDLPDFTAETEQAIDRAENEIARLTPAITEKIDQALHCPKMEKKLQESQRTLQKHQRTLHNYQQRLQQRQQKLRHELSGDWAEI
jgi:serine protease Do